ncbi:MAG TPA: FxLYD domain-containing protein, partial [Candidatus Limnocylindrales bacterium]|nr:FxLYD domain-containing protein [Candidatus Limnocylindrales bacterium]
DAGPATTVQIVPPEELAGFQPSATTDETFTIEDVATTSTGGQTTTTGTIAGTFATDESFVQVVAVYRDAAGAIVGGATGGVDTVPAGASVPFEIVEVSPAAAIAATEVYWQVTR